MCFSPVSSYSQHLTNSTKSKTLGFSLVSGGGGRSATATMSMSKSSKMLQFINYRMRVTMQDGRQLVGKFMAFDRHMNLVLGDCEEFRNLPPAKGKKNNEERDDRHTLGLLLLRGEEVISMTVEGPPPQEESRAKASNACPSMTSNTTCIYIQMRNRIYKDGA